MELSEVFQKLAIALFLGLLVGLQREHVQSQVAGIRTFALITLLGAVSALLAVKFGGWILAAGGVTVAAMLVMGNLPAMREGKESLPGVTTEIAALLMYAVGAYLVIGHTAVAVALGGGVALVLHFKAPMHAFVAKMGARDLTAIMQFVLIALVILPVLPDQEYGPYQALNPRNIWLMVCLIVGINLGGYIAYKLLGDQAGAALGGVLGGLVSSTATTVSYARRYRDLPNSAGLAALVIMIASTVAVVRVLVEVAVAAPSAFWEIALPLAVLLGWMAVISGGMYYLARGEKTEISTHANPAELTAAILFGALYAGVVLAVAAAKDFFGESGLYGVAVLSGLHDLDAITLSTARFVEQEHVTAAIGWRVIVTATLSNLVMKSIFVAVLGHRRLLTWIGIAYGAAFAGGVALLLFWPDLSVANNVNPSP